MTIPELLLALMVLTAIWMLADAGLRLWRRRPLPYGSRRYADVLVVLSAVFATLSLHAPETRDIAAKAVIVTLVSVAVVLRLIVRKRFGVQSGPAHEIPASPPP
jgi:hypothetical protein